MNPLTTCNHTNLNYLLIHKKISETSGSNRLQKTQTFPGVRDGDILCHIAERRLLCVPESHWTLWVGWPQQKFDYMQMKISLFVF